MPHLRFAKYHGLGNDFVLVDGPEVDAQRAIRLCDRHRGVGADGIASILEPRTRGALAFMHIFNPDGSEAAMCGNAIRCVARHLAERRGIEGAILIDTPSGPKRCTVHRGHHGAVEAVSVEMGPARVDGDEEFHVLGEKLHGVAVSMGNPHVVFFDEPTVERARAIGPHVERMVEGGVNVGLVRPSPGHLDLVVWERGAGLTQACGTGACAATVAAARAGVAPRGTPVEVRLPGGSLFITVGEDLRDVTMRGPAECTFEGETEL